MPTKTDKKPVDNDKITNKLSVGTALNTMLNPLAGQPGFGQVYYPGEIKGYQGIKPTLFHAMALLATYGTGAYLARGVAYKSKVKDKAEADRKRIASYINAEMPIVSPDPVRNPKQELKEDLLGTEKIAMDKSAGLANNLVSALIPVVALVGGYAGGTALADKYYGKKEQLASEQETAVLKDKLDKLNYEKLMGVRNPPKLEKAALEGSDSAAESYVKNQEAGKTIPGFLAAIIGLGAGGVALGSAYFSKKYFDDRDENREKLKALEKALAQRAAVESEQAPVVIPQIPDKYEKALDQAGTEKGPARISSYSSVDSPVRRKALPKLPTPSMDVTDPSMRQLMSIGG